MLLGKGHRFNMFISLLVDKLKLLKMDLNGYLLEEQLDNLFQFILKDLLA
jgi:hypothetical protein